MSRKVEPVESFKTLKQTAFSGRTFAHVENKIRKDFRERLKELRRRNIDLRREELATKFVKMTVEETQMENSSNLKCTYTYEESLKLLEEVEEELRLESLMQEAESYQRDYENEIMYLVDNLYDPSL